MKKKILLVEDEPALGMLYEEELREEGYEVLIARNGKEAIQRYEEEEADLIILDIVLPVMDGIEAMNLLKEKHGKVPIILQSSYSEYRTDPRTRVADAFVMKSGDLEELKKIIRGILK